MTIFAYTELGGPLPAYVNISERVSYPGDVIVSVRASGESLVNSIILPREQLQALADSIARHLKG